MNILFKASQNYLPNLQLRFYSLCPTPVTENAALAACCNKSQTQQMSVQKQSFSDAATWENGGLPSRRPPPVLLKSVVLIGIGRGGLFFLSNYLASFWLARARFIHLCILGPSPFIFLAFGMLSVRTSSCAILASEEDSLVLPDCLQ